jgi:hypothetical protein
MTDRDAEVPLDRQDAMQTATDDGSGFWFDIPRCYHSTRKYPSTNVTPDSGLGEVTLTLLGQ